LNKNRHMQEILMTNDENRARQQRDALIPPDPRPQPMLPKVEPDRSFEREGANHDARAERQRAAVEQLGPLKDAR
jgi:hypothetical protein